MGFSLQQSADYTVSKYNLNERPEDILLEWKSEYEHLFCTEIDFFPHVERFLMHLIELNVPFGIATAGEGSLFDLFFNRYPLIKPHVRAFVTCSDVGKGKPAPDVYLECIRRIGARKEDCIIFEDTIVGLQGIKNTGCISVLVLSDHKSKEEKLALADYAIES